MLVRHVKDTIAVDPPLMKDPRPKIQIPGTAVGNWFESDAALIRLDDGRVLEAMAAQLDLVVKAGDRLTVTFDSDGRMLGWLHVDHNVGVNYGLQHG